MRLFVISVIIPVYNPGPFLGECLASLDAQTCRDFEIILVDDGSSDGSADICDAYAAKRENVHVFHGPNRGPLLARRQGMREAQGDYLMFLDADDCLRFDAVQVVTDAAEDGADVICFGCAQGVVESYAASVSTPAILASGFYQGDDYEDVKRAVCSGLFNSLCDKVFRRSLVDFDDGYAAWQSLKHGEDLFQLMPLLSAARSLRCLDEVLYFYRENPYGSSGSFKAFQTDDLREVFKRLFFYAEAWGEDCVKAAKNHVCLHGYWLLENIGRSNEPFSVKKTYMESVRNLMMDFLDEDGMACIGSLRFDRACALKMLVRRHLRSAHGVVRACNMLYGARKRIQRSQG